MSKDKKAYIVDLDGNIRDFPDFPVAVIRKNEDEQTGISVVDPIFNDKVYNNLYGRLMTLIEATTEQYKLKSVKDLFSKELNEWQVSIYNGARELAQSDDRSDGSPLYNIYTR